MKKIASFCIYLGLFDTLAGSNSRLVFVGRVTLKLLKNSVMKTWESIS